MIDCSGAVPGVQNLRPRTSASLRFSAVTGSRRGRVASSGPWPAPRASWTACSARRGRSSRDRSLPAVRQLGPGKRALDRMFARRSGRESEARCLQRQSSEPSTRSTPPPFADSDVPIFGEPAARASGDPGGIRTPDLRIRNPPLYPAELRGRRPNIARRPGGRQCRGEICAASRSGSPAGSPSRRRSPFAASRSSKGGGGSRDVARLAFAAATGRRGTSRRFEPPPDGQPKKERRGANASGKG